MARTAEGLDRLRTLELHGDSVVSFSLPFRLEVVRPTTASPRETAWAAWLAHVTRGEWKRLGLKALGSLDVLQPLFDETPGAAPPLLSMHVLDEEARERYFGPGGEIGIVLRAEAETRVLPATVHAVHVLLSAIGMGVLRVTFKLRAPADVVDLVTVAESLRRLQDVEGTGFKTAFLLAPSACDASFRIAMDVPANARKTKLVGALEHFREKGACALPGHHLGWALLASLAARHPLIRQPAFDAYRLPDVERLQREASHCYSTRCYARLRRDQIEANGVGDAGLQDLLRRLAMAEGASYASGTVGVDDDEPLFRTMRNLRDCRWGMSATGSAALVTADAAGATDGYFNTTFAGHFGAAYGFVHDLVVLQRAVLLDLEARIRALSQRRLHERWEYRATEKAVLRLREAAFQFTLQASPAVISSNARQQCAYQAARASGRVELLEKSIERQVRELDDWLERRSRRRTETFLFILTVLGTPFTLMLAYFQVASAIDVDTARWIPTGSALALVAGVLLPTLGLWLWLGYISRRERHRVETAFHGE